MARTSETSTISITDDTDFEMDQEEFTVALALVSDGDCNVTISPNTTNVIIEDNDGKCAGNVGILLIVSVLC